MRLLSAVARARDVRLDTLACDAARVPLPDRSVDTVTVINVLEHLDPGHSEAVVREALRLARRRMVVACRARTSRPPPAGTRSFDRARSPPWAAARGCRSLWGTTTGAGW